LASFITTLKKRGKAGVEGLRCDGFNLQLHFRCKRNAIAHEATAREATAATDTDEPLSVVGVDPGNRSPYTAARGASLAAILSPRPPLFFFFFSLFSLSSRSLHLHSLDMHTAISDLFRIILELKKLKDDEAESRKQEISKGDKAKNRTGLHRKKRRTLPFSIV